MIYIVRALSFTLMLAIFLPAHAFDFAKREILGFSSDGNYFAFEQYGTQDGSGYAYSDIFIIDTRTDKWVKGSPYRYLLKDGVEEISMQEGVEKARAINRAAAKDALAVITEPGIIAASNRADENLSQRDVISIRPKSFWLPDDIQVMTFRVENIALKPDSSCLGFTSDDTFYGFKLTRSGVDGIPIIMHQDKAIPKSRWCPLGYEPADVVVHISDKGKYSVAVLVRMARIGFEGSDRRFIAITGALN